MFNNWTENWNLLLYSETKNRHSYLYVQLQICKNDNNDCIALYSLYSSFKFILKIYRTICLLTINIENIIMLHSRITSVPKKNHTKEDRFLKMAITTVRSPEIGWSFFPFLGETLRFAFEPCIPYTFYELIISFESIFFSIR